MLRFETDCWDVLFICRFICLSMDENRKIVETTKWFGVGFIILGIVWYFISLNTYYFHYGIPTTNILTSILMFIIGVGFLIFSYSNKKE